MIISYNQKMVVNVYQVSSFINNTLNVLLTSHIDSILVVLIKLTIVSPYPETWKCDKLLSIYFEKI
jgi:hypothetical protein